MNSHRTTIARMMVFVILIGTAIAALRYASAIWLGLVFTLTLGVFAIAILGAVFQEGHRRAYWAGFAFLGLGYLVLCYGPWFGGEVRRCLLTTMLLDTSRDWFAQDYANYHVGPFAWGANPDYMERIGHSITSLIAALIGGSFASFFYSTRGEPAQRPEPPA